MDEGRSENYQSRLGAHRPLRRRRFLEHPLFHLLLLAATFLTTTLAGGLFSEKGGIFREGSLWDGLPFSIPVLIILGVHEMGHYLMCRRYGLAATLPYFLPSPFLDPRFIPFGTFGAVIRIKEPIRDKKVLLDVGAAGPLAGFLAALPFLFYGVAHPRPFTQALRPGTPLFDYPLLVRFAQQWQGLDPYTSANVYEHPTFMAAWFGLLVTSLNLVPIGQLDGGHVLRAAVGRRQPVVSGMVLAAALVSVFYVPPVWAFFALMATALTGLIHPPTDNDQEPLGTGRLTVALVCLGVFLLCFSPAPIRIAGAPSGSATGRQLQEKRGGPLVDERDLHHRPEDSGLNRHAESFDRTGEMFIEEAGLLRGERAFEAGAPSPGEVGGQRELGDHEHASGNLGEVPVHLPPFVFEDPKPRDLPRRLFGERRSVPLLRAEEDEQSASDAAHDGAPDRHFRAGDPLKDEFHGFLGAGRRRRRAMNSFGSGERTRKVIPR